MSQVSLGYTKVKDQVIFHLDFHEDLMPVLKEALREHQFTGDKADLMSAKRDMILIELSENLYTHNNPNR
jgi:hypothetical protein